MSLRNSWYREKAAMDHSGGGYPAAQHRRDTTGGAEGNERLTALTGLVLLVLFAAEGVTILSVRGLLTLHFFLGMLLIGPVALKACSTIYRFVRYYAGGRRVSAQGASRSAAAPAWTGCGAHVGGGDRDRGHAGTDRP